MTVVAVDNAFGQNFPGHIARRADVTLRRMRLCDDGCERSSGTMSSAELCDSS